MFILAGHPPPLPSWSSFVTVQVQQLHPQPRKQASCGVLCVWPSVRGCPVRKPLTYWHPSPFLPPELLPPLSHLLHLTVTHHLLIDFTHTLHTHAPHAVTFTLFMHIVKSTHLTVPEGLVCLYHHHMDPQCICICLCVCAITMCVHKLQLYSSKRWGEEEAWMGPGESQVRREWGDWRRWRSGLRFLSVAANPSRLSVPLCRLTGSTEKNKARQQSPLSVAITHPPAASELCVTFSRGSSSSSTL